MKSRISYVFIASVFTIFVNSFFVSIANAQANASDYTTGYRYDNAGRLVGTILPDPDGGGPRKFIATRYTYNSIGKIQTTETGSLSSWAPDTVLPSAWASYGFVVLRTQANTYDSYGRKVIELLSSGGNYALTQYSYDSVNRVQCTAQRMNRSVYATIISSLPNACAPYTRGTGAEDFGNDRITKTTYNQNSDVTEIRKAVGITTLEQAYATYTYKSDYYGRPIKGLVETVTDANGNLSSMQYDNFGRKTGLAFPSLTTKGQSNPSDTEAYTYDNNGNLKTLKKRDTKVITYYYDALNRVYYKDMPGSEPDVYSMYDNVGHLTYARFNSTSGLGISNVYNGFGQLTDSSTNVTGSTRTLSYRYDDNGNRTHVIHPDGNYFGYDYDGINLLKSIAENGVSAYETDANRIVTPHYRTDSKLANDITYRGGNIESFAYDTVSLRLQQLTQDLSGTAQDNSTTFAYNPANQITSRTTSNSVYNYVGNQNITGSYATNNLNQYTGAGGKGFGYDLNGNMTSDGDTNFTYDSENRLTTASGVKNASLSYDPLGRLYQVNSSGVITQFLYDGDSLVAEYNSSGVLLRRYAHGSRVDQPLVWYEGSAVGSGNARTMLADHQGSITAVGSTLGNIINTYDAYGIAAASNQGRFSYTGQINIPELGLYYYKARFYSPVRGRFMQTDPVGYKDQINLYAYAGNDPINKVDPSGMQTDGCTDTDRYFCSQIANDKWLVKRFTQQGQFSNDSIWLSNENNECKYGTTCPTDDQLEKDKLDNEAMDHKERQRQDQSPIFRTFEFSEDDPSPQTPNDPSAPSAKPEASPNPTTPAQENNGNARGNTPTPSTQDSLLQRIWNYLFR